MLMPKTPAQHKADERARKKEQGLVRIELWIKEWMRPKLQAYVKRLMGKNDG